MICSALRLLGMSWGVKTTCLEAPGVSLGGSGVSIVSGSGALGSALQSRRAGFFFSFTKQSPKPRLVAVYMGTVLHGYKLWDYNNKA